jgi:hypothetical protein
MGHPENEVNEDVDFFTSPVVFEAFLALPELHSLSFGIFRHSRFADRLRAE